MKIDKVHKVEPIPQPGPETLVSVSEIKEHILKVEEIEQKIEELKQLKRDTKTEIEELVSRVDAFGVDFEDFVFDAYWNLSHISAVTLRVLVKTRTGNDRYWQQFIKGSVEVTCQECGSAFKKTYTSKTQYKEDKKPKSYISIRCSECEERQKEKSEIAEQSWHNAYKTEIKALRQLPYKEYLRTEHWQVTRKRALKRAGFKCQLCSSKGKLHVHHRTYENLGNENNADLIVLCEGCHGKFHDKIAEAAE